MSESISKKGSDMDYKKIFNVSTIIPDLDAKTKYEVISTLVSLLEKKKKISNKEEVLNEVIKREALLSTGFENGIAMPHAVIRSLDKIVTSIARIPKGIDFVSHDKKPTYLVFLVCYPPQLNNTYLWLTSAISNVFREKENVNLLLYQKTSKDIHKTLVKLLENNDKIYETSSGTDTTSRDLPENVNNPMEFKSLLIRLQKLEEEIKPGKRTNISSVEKVRNIRSLIPEEMLNIYDKLKKHKYPPVVPIEGNVCKGCNMVVPNEFLNQLIQNREKIFYCPNCRRIVYLI